MLGNALLEKASKRHAAFYLRELRAATALYDQGGEQMREALKIMEDQWSQVGQAFAWAAERATADPDCGALCINFLRDGWALLSLRQTFITQARWLQTVIEAARRWDMTDGLIMGLHRLAYVLVEMGTPDRAMTTAEESLKLAEMHHMDDQRVYALRIIGMVHIVRGEYAAAQGVLKVALSLDEEVAHVDTTTRAIIMNNLGSIAFRMGDQQEAIRYHLDSLKLHQQRDNLPAIAMCQHNLAGAYWSLGNYAQAKIYYQESLALRRLLGDQRGVASSLVSLGTIYAIQRDFETARHCWEESLDIARRNGLRAMIAFNLSNLGSAARDMGQLAASVDYYEQSIMVFREVGNHYGEVDALANLGMVQLARGDRAEGEKHLLMVLRSAYESGTKPLILRALTGLAWLYSLRGAAQESVRLLGLISISPGGDDGMLKGDFDNVAQSIRSGMEDAAYNAAFVEGRDLDLNVMVETLLRVTP